MLQLPATIEVCCAARTSASAYIRTCNDLTGLAVPAEQEWDPDMENEIFNTRQQFLSLCQGNHYQFDTIRRTRHSSMMVLYHLHNPTAPAFAGTCNVCNVEIEPGDGFRCTQCDDFDMCRNCQANGMYHEHPLERQTVGKRPSSFFCTSNPHLADNDLLALCRQRMQSRTLRRLRRGARLCRSRCSRPWSCLNTAVHVLWSAANGTSATPSRRSLRT